MPRLEATLASRATSLPRRPARASVSEAMTLTRLTSEETAQWGSGTYMCVEDCDVPQVTEVRPQWFGGERSRRAESTSPTSATVSVEGTGPDRDVQALLWLAAQEL